MKAIVTGGNKGIGLAVTGRLLAKGFEVHVLSRSGLESPPTGLIAWNVDMADCEAVLATAEKIGVPDVLVNNAGMMNTRITSYNVCYTKLLRKQQPMNRPGMMPAMKSWPMLVSESTP